MEEEGTQPGCMDACQDNICMNGGKCINYFTKFECDCIGTGFTGRNCKKGK